MPEQKPETMTWEEADALNPPSVVVGTLQGTYTYWYERTRAAIALARQEKARADADALAGALHATLGLIRKAQEMLCDYLCPDSTGDPDGTMNRLLSLFDGPEQREIESDARQALASRPKAVRKRVEAVRALIEARLNQIATGDIGSLLDAVDALQEAWERGNGVKREQD